MDDPLLLTLGELIRKEISAEQLLQRVVAVMAQRLRADRGTIFLLEAARGELVSVAAQLPELPEIRVPLGQGVAGYVARTGRVVNVPRCEADHHFWRKIDQETGYQTHSMLAGPLHDTHGRLIGVVQFLNKEGAGLFDEADEARFAALSAQAAALLAETTLARPDPYAGPSPEPSLRDSFNGIIGHGAAMRAVFDSIRRVAPTEATVLLNGESGTGKGLIARALHHGSARASGPFVAVDCTNLPEGLMENELFGHERGAYTGAERRQPGRVEQAQGGTLFLDEIGDLPLQLQGKLLTVLQERTYARLGGHERLRADIRVIAATNRALEALVREGRFRQDLYYRLRVVEIALPPLRERGPDDLLQLINHFVARAARRHRRPIRRVREDALQMLLAHRWPGNVRELENCVEAAVIFADGDITPSHLPLPRRNATIELSTQELRQAMQRLQPDAAPPAPPDRFAQEPTLRDLEADYIRYLLDRHDGNRSACARALGIGRNTLLRKLKEYGLSTDPLDDDL
jgi:Nif-specific regulatory protein